MSVRLVMRRGLVCLLLGLTFALGVRSSADNESVEGRLRRDVEFLASPECEGRGPGTAGIDKAADYIARQFQKAGLKPGPKGYFQPFEVFGTAKLAEPNRVRLRGPLGQTIDLRPGRDFEVFGASGSGRVEAAVVFVGYGVSAPRIGYEDYKDVDVAGKIVIALRHTPRWDSEFAPFDGDAMEEHSLFSTKLALAESLKAAALVVVNDASESAEGDKLMNFSDTRASAGTIPFVHLRRSVLEPMLEAGLGTRLADLERAIDRDLQPRSAVLKGWTATIETRVARPAIPVKNVVGVLEGRGPLAGETVVIGAHYDHLGYGGPSSLAKKGTKSIHHGADDNASGTSALMELARRFASDPKRQGRRLVFIAFSAEEMGLLGSQHYCNREPLFPLAETVAMVNLDMVGRLRPDPKSRKDLVLVEGTGTAKGFDELVAKLADGFQLNKAASSSPFSDHDSFYKKKIPVLFYWTDKHEDYHKPSDTADRINVTGLRKVTELAEKTVAHLATVPERPEYVFVPSPFKFMAGKMPRLGIAPTYHAEVKGVLVGGVSEGGPASKAGIKTGDVIVELAGRQVTNLDTYMLILRRQRPDREIDAVVLRDGKSVRLKVTPR